MASQLAARPAMPGQATIAEVERAADHRPLVRTGMAVLALLLAAVAVWIALAPVSGAAIAPGFVKVDMNRKTVQHQEGGIVGEILVRDGSKVRAGDVLVVLSDVRVDASRELVQTQLDAETAKAARLEAEQSWSPVIAFPQEWLLRGADRRLDELRTREKSLFQARRSALNSQVELIRSQIQATQAEIRARDGQMESDRQAIKLQREELKANESLLASGFVSNARLLALQRSLAELESRLAESEAERARAVQKVADLELRAETLRSTFMQEAAATLRQTSAQIFDLRERLRPTQDAEQRQRITAPISGEVVDLKVTSLGSVIAPREPLLDIVPDDAELIVEAHVRPEDISYVHADLPADVRLTAFRQRITPTVQGTVTYVSADRLIDKATNAPYYVARITVPQKALDEAGGLRLQAGMPAEVYIRTSSRTPLQYFFDPITGFLQRAMRQH